VTIWATGNTVKVGPKDPRPAETSVWDGERVSLKAARREWESFQVVINSDQARLVSYQVFDLEGLRGSIRGANVDVYREVYLPVATPSADRATGFTVGEGPGRYPDPLVPTVGHTNVAAGENTVLWFDFFVPPDTAAGKYEGRVLFKWSGGEYEVPLDLTVWDFELVPPDPAPFVAAVYVEGVCDLYDVKADSGEGRALVEKYNRLLRDHGFEPTTREAFLSTYEGATFYEGMAYRDYYAGQRGCGDAVAFLPGGPAEDIDRPAADHRLVGWALWRLGGGVAGFDRVSYFPRKNAEPLADDPRNETANGAGALIYPVADPGGGNRPAPSLRLKMLREAAEDYAYLALLRDTEMAAYADELAAGVVPVMPAPGEAAPDAATFDEGRNAAAVALVKSRWGQGIAENVVQGKAVSDEGTPVAGATVRVGPTAAVTGRDGEYELRHVPRGRSLVATAPGYERAGSSGAGGRGDFYMKRILRRGVLNVDGSDVDVDEKSVKLAPRADGNVAGGPALVGRVEANKSGVLKFRPPLSDWRTFGVFALELYGGPGTRVRAIIRVEDDGGAFYEELFFVAPETWTTARVDVAAAGGRRYLEPKGKGDGLSFRETPAVDFSHVKEIEVELASAASGEVRLGRVWLEAAGE
jgi:hypothetical protein